MRLSVPARPAVGAALTLSLAAALAACAGGAGPGARNGTQGARTGPAPGPTFETRNLAPARAEVRDADGRVVGQATFTQAPHGLLVTAELTGLPAGVHALHVHDVGRCEPPFTSAGAHYNPLVRQHGVQNRAGYHAGDLPNFTAPATGTVRVDAVTRDLQLGAGVGTLFDNDGSSIMIHSARTTTRATPAATRGRASRAA
jgi:Cu-Zn family superoxide dismutase